MTAKAFLLTATALLLAPVAAAAQNLPAPTLDPHDLSGVWWTASNEPTFRPLAGAIPFTPAGRKAYAANAAGLKAGTIDDPAISRCLAPGPARVMAAPYPLQIVQTAREVTILPEAWHAYRQVYMGAAHTNPDELDPSFMGESVGKWEGNTLVIDTMGLKDNVWLDASGIPHSDRLHIIERLRKLPGGTQFEDLITFNDPTIFTHPWTARRLYNYRPDVRLTDYFCGENNRDIAGAQRLPRLPPAIAKRPAQPVAPVDFSGVWTHKKRGRGAGGGEFRYALAVTSSGGPVPMQPWAQAMADRYKQAIADHHPITTSVNRCLGFGMPDFLTQPYPYKFVQTGDLIVMLAEADHQYRLIFMNQPHDRLAKPSWNGHSIGHWEGDTLVVETIGQNDKSLFSGAGIPKTETLKLTEHLRLVQDGAVLENRITVEDPATFTQSWEAKWELDRTPPGTRLLEYMCPENERDVALFATGNPNAKPDPASH